MNIIIPMVAPLIIARAGGGCCATHNGDPILFFASLIGLLSVAAGIAALFWRYPPSYGLGDRASIALLTLMTTFLILVISAGVWVGAVYVIQNWKYFA